jgi:hypothetical protein
MDIKVVTGWKLAKNKFQKYWPSIGHIFLLLFASEIESRTLNVGTNYEQKHKKKVRSFFKYIVLFLCCNKAISTSRSRMRSR